MHKAGLDKAQRCADRLAHGKESLKPMAHKPAYDGVDAVFVNGGRFIHDLGIVYNSLREYRKAEKLREKGLLIREKVLGTEHPDTAMSYHNLAGIYDSQGEYKTALTYYLKSYKVLVLKLGLNDSNTQMVYENMKSAYTKWKPEKIKAISSLNAAQTGSKYCMQTMAHVQSQTAA